MMIEYDLALGGGKTLQSQIMYHRNVHLQNEEILPFVTAWMVPENIMQSEISQSESETYGFTYRWNLMSKTNTLVETEHRLTAVRGEGWGGAG